MTKSLKEKLTAASGAEEVFTTEAEAEKAQEKVAKKEDEFKRIFDGIVAGKNFTPYAVIPKGKLGINKTVEKNVLHEGENLKGERLVLVRIKDEYL